MSAPPRNLRGGGRSRARAGTSTNLQSRGRGTNRARGGRGRGGAMTSTTSKAEALLQGLQSGSLNQKPGALRRSSGRAPTQSHQSSSRSQDRHPDMTSFSSSRKSPPPSQRDYMHHMTAKFQHLKTKREGERAKAIKDGFLADPEKKTSLDKAITPAGTCTEMCPPFERVERIVQNMVDKTEKVANDETGRDVPSEERMIKRFRRSAAGYDEQLPSDIRTPETLQMTLDYLLENVVGGEERLATIHKFVWDRTRGIRNDFSIQQVTKEKDVRIAVNCFERIARFHILSLHQLSNPENLAGEHFDAHQEREQLNNTLLSLMYYYDDNRGRQDFENEAEFRAYCIIFELQSQQPDLEDRMQSWPQDLLNNPRISTAFKLYSAAGNTLYDQGPLKPQAAFDIAQGNALGFWKLLMSKNVAYLMSCVAEIYFGQVRFMALQGLWKSIKRAPASMQARLQDWTVGELTKLLGFDDDEQALEFCGEYNLGFKFNDAGEQYLDFTSQQEMILDKSSTPNKQVFSFGIVEEKRYHRTLVSVINGVGVAQAIREGLIMEQPEVEDDEAEEDTEANDDNSMFVPETKKEDIKSDPRNPFLMFNPQASIFTPTASTSQACFPTSTSSGLSQTTGVGKTDAATPLFPFDDTAKVPITGIFGSTAIFKNPFGPQPTTSQASSSTFTSAATAAVGSISSFGMPSFPASAPSSSAPLTAPSGVNNAWPPILVNGLLKSHKPGDDPELVPAHELGTSPLKDPLPMPLMDKTNIPSPKQNGEASFAVKSPSSPRPGFKALPPTTEAEQPLFPELQTSVNPPVGLPASDSNIRPKSSPVSAQSPNSAKELFPSSSNQPLTSASNPADQMKGIDTSQDRTSSYASQSSPLVSKGHTTKQPFSPKSTSVPPITTTKSAIPPTFTPNTSPTFTSPANTKPKHKSPLGSQPPLFATEANAKAVSPKQSTIDPTRAAHNLATVGFLEPHGILQQYIEHTATTLIEHALRQFEREEPLRAAQSARHQILAKKYCTRWNSICWRRKINRNANSRREHLAQSIKKESQRRARGDAELEAILEAQKQKERIQAEQLRRSQEDPNPQIPVSGFWNGPAKPTVAGHKRKSLPSDEMSPASIGHSPRKVAKANGHRRSKTISGVSSMSKALSLYKETVSPSPPRLNSSILSGRSVLLDRNRSILKRSIIGRKTDSTNTDYFRLKAIGIDPETPFIPDTKTSLERKRRRQDELSHLTPRKRAHTFSSVKARTPEREVSTSAKGSQTPRNITAPETARPMAQKTQPEGRPKLLDDDDEFLRQIRKVRAAMSADTEWFRTQAAQIKKEVEQEEEEELRRSASQQSSTNSTGAALFGLKDGLARVNGYDYAPIMPQLGSQHSLSRTEQRIRATGAHGLATKPVSDYLPIAMSKSTRASLVNDKEPNRSKKRKGRTKRGEKDGKYVYESDEYEEEVDILEMEERIPTRRWARRVNHKRQITAPAYSVPTHEREDGVATEGRDRTRDLQHTSSSVHQPVTFDDDLFDEEEEVLDQDEEYVYASQNEVVVYDGDEAEDEDEDEDEEEQEDNESPDDDSGLDENGDHNLSPAAASSTSSTNANLRASSQVRGTPTHKPCPFHMRLRTATPERLSSLGQDGGGTQMSRATSGTGVSLDDALVLSD